MTELVFDFKDIASRMKGDLFPRSESEIVCLACNSTGLDPRYSDGSPCPHCKVQVQECY